MQTRKNIVNQREKGLYANIGRILASSSFYLLNAFLFSHETVKFLFAVLIALSTLWLLLEYFVFLDYDRYTFLSFIPACIDLVGIGLMIYLTGGIASPVTFTYIAILAISVIYGEKRQSRFIYIFVNAFLFFLSVFSYLSVIPSTDLYGNKISPNPFVFLTLNAMFFITSTALYKALRAIMATNEKILRQTEDLNILLNNLNRDISLKAILENVSKYVEKNFHFPYYGFSILSPDKKYLYFKQYSLPQSIKAENVAKLEQLKIAVGDGETGLHATAFAEKKAIFVSDVQNENRFPIRPEILQIFNHHAIIVIPIVLQGERIGTLDFFSMKQVNLSSFEFQQLSILGEQLAGIIKSSELFSIVQQEKDTSDKLLTNILPKTIAAELKSSGKVESVLFPDVSVLFTDFKSFTTISQQLGASELVEKLHAYFSYFDDMAQQHGLEKIKTIGDSYMCAAGIPERRMTHAIDACLLGLEICYFADKRNEEAKQNNQALWEIRVGINSGALMAGVVGKWKFAYDIWGDTVNMASRMESFGVAGKVNISEYTYELVKEFFDCEYRGEIEVKSQGKVKMYLLDRLRKKYSQDTLGFTPNKSF
ncbi:MAG: adenylate/guanylate cyclase domain-containing protein, partial [Spirochaetota bacterium]